MHTIFFVRREFFFHKIQYSKVFKFDIAAAVIGIAISTVISMLVLSSIGTCSVDLSDLFIIFYYVILIYILLKNFFFLLEVVNNLVIIYYFIIMNNIK